MFDVMFSIISKQPDPNFLPLYDKYFKPKMLVLIVTKAMLKNAENFIQAIEGVLPNGNNPEMILVNDEKKINTLKDQIEEKVKPLLDDNKSIVFNITGGTKLMSIALLDVWRHHNDKTTAIYLDITENHFQVFKGYADHRYDVEEQEYTLKQLFDFKSYFKARGIIFEKKPPVKILPQEIKQMFYKRMLDHEIVSKPLIAKFNAICHGGEQEVSPNQKERFDKLFAGMEDYIALIYREAGDQIFLRFNFLEQREIAYKYFGGGWLEDYCYDIVKEQVGTKNVILDTDIYRNDNGEKGTKNELDVCFLYKGTLHVIEVKSIQFSKFSMGKDGTKIKQDPQDVIHKLISLGDDFGLKTKLCLFSFNNLPDSLMKRAAEKKIQVFQGQDICDLTELRANLRTWINH